jgi:hypothetical protein
MSGTSVLVGLLLIALGVGGYYASNQVSPTALIPAAFGVVIAMLGMYGRHPDRRRTAMHLAMGIALVGILGSITGLFGAIRHFVSPGPDALGLATISRALMASLLIVYLIMGVRSFIAARRSREAGK